METNLQLNRLNSKSDCPPKIIKRSKHKLIGTIMTTNEVVRIVGYYQLPLYIKKLVEKRLKEETFLSELDIFRYEFDAEVQRYSSNGRSKNTDRARIIAKTIAEFEVKNNKKSLINSFRFIKFDETHILNFKEILIKSKYFANFLENNKEVIINSLINFETFNVVNDEIERSKDYLLNIDKNEQFFKKSVNEITSFLPLNQPLYSTICFGIVPSFISKNVHIRPPTCSQKIFRVLESLLNLREIFPNLTISFLEKEEFIKYRSKISDAVIFTGKYSNAMKVKKLFSPECLFILNGAGHNPIVVTQSANLDEAAESTLRVCLQNQGQDCAAPNSILVHKDKIKKFKQILLEQLKKIEPFIGDYENKNNILGPNSQIDHVLHIAKLMSDCKNYCVYGGEINPISGLIKPVVFEKPLCDGPNFKEFFAPVIMIQEYSGDKDLALYFENPQYREHAMYVTVFGESEYVLSLIEKKLHTKENILCNTDLHLEERGFKPYGGLGTSASCVFFRGKKNPGATLPEREIYNYLVYPNLICT